MTAHNQHLSEFLTTIQQRRNCGGRDRAAVVTGAVLHIVRRALLEWLDGDDVSFAAARTEVETLLRAEFHDIARTTLNEIRREDG
jgi:uncharacterized protein (DUF2267 family)